MWEAFKNIVTSVKDTLGIEIPELPVDVGSAGEAASGLVQGVTDQAAAVSGDVLATAGEAATGGAAQVTEAVSGISSATEAAAQAVPDLTDLPSRR